MPNHSATVPRPPRFMESTVTKKALATSLVAAAEMPASPNSSLLTAVPPKATIQMKVNTVGTRITPRMNSRMVRPRETRAINTPTKGAHDSHQPQ
ncbi:hypothetical protein D3C84_660830 [compost metagenome]